MHLRVRKAKTYCAQMGHLIFHSSNKFCSVKTKRLLLLLLRTLLLFSQSQIQYCRCIIDPVCQLLSDNWFLMTRSTSCITRNTSAGATHLHLHHIPSSLQACSLWNYHKVDFFENRPILNIISRNHVLENCPHFSTSRRRISRACYCESESWRCIQSVTALVIKYYGGNCEVSLEEGHLLRKWPPRGEFKYRVI